MKKTITNENDWAKTVVEMLAPKLTKFKIEFAKPLIYANEIMEYQDNLEIPKYNEMKYQTDILIYEFTKKEKFIPRVVIETKINSISTHNSITYSQKSASHKYVHPYLRYGIFLGNRGNLELPGRLFRHGAHFDFMHSWRGYLPKDNEMPSLLKILKNEITASQKLEEMIFNSRKRNRTKYYSIHKPLVTLESKK